MFNIPNDDDDFDDGYDDGYGDDEDEESGMPPGMVTPQNTISDISSNTGSAGFIPVGAIVQNSSGDYYIVAEAPAILGKFDRKQPQFYAHVTNESGDIKLDLSLFSPKSLNTFNKYNPEFKEILEKEKEHHTTAGVLKDADFNKLQQNVTLVSVDDIEYRFSSSFTEPLIKAMFGMEEEAADAGDVVDSLLDNLFSSMQGGGVATAEDSEFVEDYEDDEALELDIQVDPLKDIMEQFEGNIEEPEEAPDSISQSLIDGTLTNNPIVKCFNVFREAIETDNVARSLKIEKELLESLEYLLTVEIEKLPGITQQIIVSLCKNINDNESLNTLFDKVEFFLKKERYLYESFIVEDNVNENDILHIEDAVRENTFLDNNEELLEEFMLNRENYNRIRRCVRMNMERFRDNEYIPFLCLSVQLAHLVNKNMLKRMKEEEKRQFVLQTNPEYSEYVNEELSELIQDIIDHSQVAKDNFNEIYKNTLTSYVES